MVIALLLSCATPTTAPARSDNAATTVELTPVEVLERASLDIRGVRASEAEIAAVEADPTALDTSLDRMFDDARFGERIVDLYSELLLTRTEAYAITGSQYGLDDVAFMGAVGEEPLRMIEHVAVNDLPYTELVTGDWTMANEVLGDAWPLDYPSDGEGWMPAHYTDGRPAAGLLSTNGLWWRYTSTISNANRGRANAISRIFLCEDYLSRPIEFDRNVNLLDGDAVNDALRENPACVSCHTTLDPLAGFLYGFWWFDYTNRLEASRYWPGRELSWRDYSGLAPAYYGQPGDNLADLGQLIAADRKFASCATESAFELLLRREVTTEDDPSLTHHRNAFISGALTIRALMRSILDDDAYRSGKKLVTADLLASSVADLTGFRWTYADYDMLQSDVVGFRTLAGGVDGVGVTRAAATPNASIVLVQERLAEAAAAWVVDVQPDRLFTIDLAATPDTDLPAMEAQVQALHLRIFGDRVAADGDAVTAALELWSDVYAVEGDTHRAWAAVLSALLRDPDFLLY